VKSVPPGFLPSGIFFFFTMLRMGLGDYDGIILPVSHRGCPFSLLPSPVGIVTPPRCGILPTGRMSFWFVLFPPPSYFGNEETCFFLLGGKRARARVAPPLLFFSPPSFYFLSFPFPLSSWIRSRPLGHAKAISINFFSPSFLPTISPPSLPLFLPLALKSCITLRHASSLLVFSPPPFSPSPSPEHHFSRAPLRLTSRRGNPIPFLCGCFFFSFPFRG